MGTQFSRTDTQPPWGMNSISDFENTDAGGKAVSLGGWGEPFYSTAWCHGSCTFQTAVYDSERNAGIIPLISWSSKDSGYTGSGPAPRVQPRGYRLRFPGRLSHGVGRRGQGLGPSLLLGV
jgi:hypothetical protein